MKNIIGQREVFFIHGHDPRGAEFYYSKYEKHLLKQNKLNNLNASISERSFINGMYSWKITSCEDGNDVNTKYNVLGWEDIISKYWTRGPASILMNFLYIIKNYILTGIIFQYIKLAPLFALVILSVVLYVFNSISIVLMHSYFSTFILLKYIPWYFVIFLVIVSSYVFIKIMLFLGGKLFLFWAMNMLVFISKLSKNQLVGIDTKAKEMSNTILEVLESDAKNDEILVVAHSAGVILLVSLMANLLRECKEKKIDISNVKILTLGSVLPMVYLDKNTTSIKNDLEYLYQEKNLVWLDYTSKADGICFPSVDLKRFLDLPAETLSGPNMLLAEFDKLLTKETYKWHRRRYKYMDIHSWYIRSHEIAGTYDYFKITAGCQPLEKGKYL